MPQLAGGLSSNSLISQLATFGIVGGRRELSAVHGAALSPRQGTKSEDSNPPGCHPKPGAIGGRIATLPAAHRPRQALLNTMRSQASSLLSAVQAAPDTKMQ